EESDLKGVEEKEVTVVDGGMGEEKGFEEIDVKGKVGVMEGGGIGFVDKVENGKGGGGMGVVMYKKTDGEIRVDVGGVGVGRIKV
uniref:PA domain-containing protein n=1 Tax=Bacillus pumilus TaxID=1408 RepID=UPI0034D983EE